MDTDRPHIVVAAGGRGTLRTGRAAVALAVGPSSFERFRESGLAYGALLHAGVRGIAAVNQGDEPLVLLDVFETGPDGDPA